MDYIIMIKPLIVISLLIRLFIIEHTKLYNFFYNVGFVFNVGLYLIFGLLLYLLLC